MNFLYRAILVTVIAALMVLMTKAQPLQARGITQSASEDFLARGTTKVLSGDYGGAIQDLEQAIQRRPNDAKAHMNHGLVRAIVGDKQGAIADFNQALHINPDSAVTYYNRGFVRSQLEDYEGAMGDFG